MSIRRSILSLAVISTFVVWMYSCNVSGHPGGYTLSAGVEPEDGGTVTPRKGEFEEGEEVEISANPSGEYSFMHWAGDIEGDDNPAKIIIDADKEITAVFRLREYPLHIDISGEGAVTEEVIEEKAKDYAHGTVVELTADPAEGWRFAGWQGDIEGEENPVTVVMEEEKSVSAQFERREFALNIAIEGEGSVTEEEVQTKTKDYAYGTMVKMTAEPETGWRFVRWEGDLEGESNPDTVTVDEEKHVRAVFEQSIVSHGYVDGVTPGEDDRFAERSYTTVRADWEGPGGDKRWLGMNLGATGEPESVKDDDAGRAGWYFRFNREQGYYHDGSFGKADGFPLGSSNRSTIQEDSGWEEPNDPCRKLLGGDWRIPTDEEWLAAAESGSRKLNLHAAGYLSPSFGHPLGTRGDYGTYWSSTQFNPHNGIFAEIDGNGRIGETEPRLKHHGLPVRCIEE